MVNKFSVCPPRKKARSKIRPGVQSFSSLGKRQIDNAGLLEPVNFACHSNMSRQTPLTNSQAAIIRMKLFKGTRPDFPCVGIRMDHGSLNHRPCLQEVGDEGVQCDGCQGWAHYRCAGWKSLAKARQAGDYFCPECRKLPASGATNSNPDTHYDASPALTRARGKKRGVLHCPAATATDMKIK
jgi:hypothetical protein